MLLAGTATDVDGFGWSHLTELLADSDIAAIVESGLTERERKLLDYCVKVAYSFDHNRKDIAYQGSGANIACSLTRVFFGTGYDYGSPYTSHDDCECATCVAVRTSNAKQASVFNCISCGRRDDAASSPQPTSRRWLCPKCASRPEYQK